MQWHSICLTFLYNKKFMITLHVVFHILWQLFTFCVYVPAEEKLIFISLSSTIMKFLCSTRYIDTLCCHYVPYSEMLHSHGPEGTKETWRSVCLFCLFFFFGFKTKMKFMNSLCTSASCAADTIPLSIDQCHFIGWFGCYITTPQQRHYIMYDKMSWKFNGNRTNVDRGKSVNWKHLTWWWFLYAF